jgi:CheY-like chemotaxis protein
MSKKLLLADDSVTIQKVIELTFADEDIEVIAVSNGAQAISIAPIERPDIVLADVGMPERDGYEVASFIKRTPGLSHVPVLLLTGAFEPIDEGRAKAAGCDGVLVKPFEPQMVISRVRDLIAGKRSTPASGAGPVAVVRPPSSPTPPVPADEYFDRLGASLGAQRESPVKPVEAGPTAADLGKELATWEPGGSPTPPASAPSSAISAPSSAISAPSSAPSASSASSAPSLAQAFAALLAAEQGKVSPPPPVNEQALREDVIEQVTRRVIERMTDNAVREVVAPIAERLVREEIDRIRSSAR